MSLIAFCLFQVLYDETLDRDLFSDNTVVKSAMCVILTEVVPFNLLQQLPNDIESLTLIQGSDSGNKSFRFSYLDNFKKLISLELLGSTVYNRNNISYFTCEIDKPLAHLKYFNLERIFLKTSKSQVQKLANELNDETITFEYVQKYDQNSPPLTMLQESNKEILPYNKYVQQEKTENMPLFIGFTELLLLRIMNCDLNMIHWEMFDGLHKLKYLILEKNNLRFIPDFAFYGTPNVKSLSLAHNNLLNIQITDLAGLLELEFLDLSYNNFSQLSELSLPPFPKLKLANFANNPITIIFPNTFEVMNTTDSLIVGNEDTQLSLLPDAFVGLKMLTSLTVNNLNIPLLKRDLLVGMPSLKSLTFTGNITEIEFDAFLEVRKLEILILSKCNMRNVSMDAFIGLDKLSYLDLSSNQLTYLPPGVLDPLRSIKELYLNRNNFTVLPHELFSKLHLKLLRLNENPWHCSCQMSDWKPVIVNRLKQKVYKPCEVLFDKSISCNGENRFTYKYVYDNKVAPKCVTPEIYVNWSVFHVMRRQLRCPDYKPRIKKLKLYKHMEKVTTQQPQKEITSQKVIKIDLLDNRLNINDYNHEQLDETDEFNELNVFNSNYLKQKHYNPNENDVKALLKNTV